MVWRDLMKPNTHRRRRRDSTVEQLSRVDGVNAPIGSRAVLQFTIFCAVELLRTLVTSDDIMTSLLKQSYQHRSKFTYSQTADCGVCLVSFQLVDRIRRQSSWIANCVHTADNEATQLNSWVASRRRWCVSGLNAGMYRTKAHTDKSPQAGVGQKPTLQPNYGRITVQQRVLRLLPSSFTAVFLHPASWVLYPIGYSVLNDGAQVGHDLYVWSHPAMVREGQTCAVLLVLANLSWVDSLQR